LFWNLKQQVLQHNSQSPDYQPTKTHRIHIGRHGHDQAFSQAKRIDISFLLRQVSSATLVELAHDAKNPLDSAHDVLQTFHVVLHLLVGSAQMFKKNNFYAFIHLMLGNSADYE